MLTPMMVQYLVGFVVLGTILMPLKLLLVIWCMMKRLKNFVMLM